MTQASHREIVIEPLTQKAFKAFGDVIEVSPEAQHFTINYGFTERYHNLAKLDLLAQGGQCGLSIFVSTPLPLPLELKIMERHPLSSQAFIPMGDQPYLVVVAPPGDFDRTGLRCFLAHANQGVNYHAGTWHHFCLALNKASQFLVVDRISPANHEGPKNCDEIELDSPLHLSQASIKQALEKLLS